MNIKLIIVLIFSTLFLSGCYNSQKSSPLVAAEDINTEKPATATLEIDLEKLEATVPILIYHHIREIQSNDSQDARTFIVIPENFEKQLKYLADNNFTTIYFDDLVNYFKGISNLPEKPIIITFDDGTTNQYNNAFPFLQKYNLVATFYLFTNPIDINDNYLNSVQIKEMSNEGMAFGSHGWYHLYLDKEKDDAVLNKEIISSKQKLEKILNQEVTTFAYPFGSYLPETIDRLKAAGYTTARGIVNGQDHTSSDLFKLNGYFITNDFQRFKNIVN
ncbi:polysaccharide deacetylase family protein [Candidatus Falkowbacteria bacterium]|uniref:Polysaccharide deacetylase n=1 Tax=Candidatus Buchananbacteria bacterium CG10_big_fil_rev_8_21_14_0_10_33_19 TaxID=1974525 RepID=A0A2H0W4S9_9BACT|nr:polysaccharide deacetylase family protein [Candidatus Falkowbacteria bacterium]PIS06356.1 MAG: polysaccharide deacetylase [Candidatus Buchananbacteria bacterium CG10_big_fil_rev_8_21_14_0_10_33_19]